MGRLIRSNRDQENVGRAGDDQFLPKAARLLRSLVRPACASALFMVLPLFSAKADSFQVTFQGTNGCRIPRIIGASGSIDDPRGFTGFDYFEWFGITHHRYWFKPSFSTLNPAVGVTNAAGFTAAAAAVRANPQRQGTASDVFFDWSRFHAEFDANQRFIFSRFRDLGIVPMMCNTVFTDQDPLTDWGGKFEYWKQWYGYVYFFASQYGITMYEFRNEPNQKARAYEQWESHWLVAADAMRKAMADVNANYGQHLTLCICGPTTPGPYWNYALPHPDVDPHGWGSVSWGKIHTDIYGRLEPSIWNYGMYDYHMYSYDGAAQRNALKSLRQNLAHATNAPNSTMPILISEFNTSTGGHFGKLGLDTEDLRYGIGLAQILASTATLGPAGLGDDGGFFLFKLGAPNGKLPTLGNQTAYVSAAGANNYGGVSRGGACFQLYAHHFRGGKPVLSYTVTAGADSKRPLAAVWDQVNQAYYVYLSNVNGTNATAWLDVSGLNVRPGAPVTVARVDANNTGQVTDYLSVSASSTIAFSAPNNSAMLVWIPQANSAGAMLVHPPANDTWLAVGSAPTNHGAEPAMLVSLDHATPGNRRIGFMQFNLAGLTPGNRFLLKLCGHNIGTNQSARAILHIYGAGSRPWSETNLAWSAAPGVGRYYTSTNTLAPATGQGLMVDIEDNYEGVTSGVGTGLGLCGKFLGPVSFSSSAWANNYLDVTDYVKSLLASNQTQATFVVAHIVRYNVNQYSNSTCYAQGVYDYDGEITEIGAKEHSHANLRPGLLVWKQP